MLKADSIFLLSLPFFIFPTAALHYYTGKKFWKETGKIHITQEDKGCHLLIKSNLLRGYHFLLFLN